MRVGLFRQVLRSESSSFGAASSAITGIAARTGAGCPLALGAAAMPPASGKSGTNGITASNAAAGKARAGGRKAAAAAPDPSQPTLQQLFARAGKPSCTSASAGPAPETDSNTNPTVTASASNAVAPGSGPSFPAPASISHHHQQLQQQQQQESRPGYGQQHHQQQGQALPAAGGGGELRGSLEGTPWTYEREVFTVGAAAAAGGTRPAAAAQAQAPQASPQPLTLPSGSVGTAGQRYAGLGSSGSSSGGGVLSSGGGRGSFAGGIGGQQQQQQQQQVRAMGSTTAVAAVAAAGAGDGGRGRGGASSMSRRGGPAAASVAASEVVSVISADSDDSDDVVIVDSEGEAEVAALARGVGRLGLTDRAAAAAAEAATDRAGLTISSTLERSEGLPDATATATAAATAAAAAAATASGASAAASASVSSGAGDMAPVFAPKAAARTKAAAGGGGKGRGGGAGGGGGGGGGGAGGGRAARAAKPKVRTGSSRGGELLWTELSPEEREAAGGRTWIRWEPLPEEQPSASTSSAATSSRAVFHLFSFDVETVDFMRQVRGSNQRRFPRPDQVRLLEVAAVDMGPVTAASDTHLSHTADAGCWVQQQQQQVFSTLVNPGRSFKNHKTAEHNRITYAQVSAPHVPHTAEALQRLFDFIAAACQRTAAAAAAAAASGGQPAAGAGGGGGGCGAGGGGGGGGSGSGVRVVPLLMAHNGAHFDFPVLRQECGRVGLAWPQDWWYLDTLVAAKALWAKADWPRQPPDSDDEEGEEEGEEGEAAAAAAQGGGKASLSMRALKSWAGVLSDGEAHRAGVDAADLAAVWGALWERWGRPSPMHLERLRGRTGESRAAAGPLHRLGLLSQSARLDELSRHMQAAVAPHLRHLLQPPQQQLLQPLQPSQQRGIEASEGEDRGGKEGCPDPDLDSEEDADLDLDLPPLVLTMDELKREAQAGRLRLEPTDRGGGRGGGGAGGGGGGGRFRSWRLLRVRPPPAAALALAPEAAEDEGPEGELEEGVAGGSSSVASSRRLEQQQQQQQQQQAGEEQLVPFTILLRGCRLKYIEKQYAYNDAHAPAWKMLLMPSPKAPGSSSSSSSSSSSAAAAAAGGAEGASSSASDFADLVTFLEKMASYAATALAGRQGVKVHSCGRQDAAGVGKNKEPVMGVRPHLHAAKYDGPAPGQLSWSVLATMSAYDKKTASYKECRWPQLDSYIPQPRTTAAAASFGGHHDSPHPPPSHHQQPGSPDRLHFSAYLTLDEVKADNLQRVAAQLPDVRGGDVLDVALWPELVWVSDSGAGVKLQAVHLVRRSGRAV